MQIAFAIKTSKKQEIVDITNKVKEIVDKSDVEFGKCLVYAPHTTCAVIINESFDASVCEDILNSLDHLIPEHAKYEHNKIDNNAPAHFKSTLLGASKEIPIQNGLLQLGKYQGIALAEFDGPRERKIIVSI